jgi:hypothetical protein
MFVELQVAPEVVKTEAGCATIWRGRPGLVFSQVEGRMVMAHAQVIMAVVDAEMRARPGTVKVFHDFTAIDSYEVAVQARMSAWSVTAVRSLERIVIGVSSPLVALAVRTANLASGGRFELVQTREQLVAAACAEWLRPVLKSK